MDTILCDELVQEIFQKLSPSSFPSVSLVSKRWLHLYRSSRTSLSLRLSLHNSTVAAFSSVLSNYPSLSSLSIATSTLDFSDQLLVAVSLCLPNLKHLRFSAGPVSVNSLISLSNSCTYLTSLTVNLSRPLVFIWVVNFPNLKELSIFLLSKDGVEEEEFGSENDDFDAELGLESVSLSGIRKVDWRIGWLWRSCRKLKKLQLKSCEGVGDGGSFSSFVHCLKGVQEVELRTCRSIVDGVLMKLAENCDNLNSLLVYDGGSREGLLQFINQCRCNLQKLDFRLPMDLHNDHLSAVAMNFRSLSILRLQSCCLVTGEGLKTLGISMSSGPSGLEELALINCDVVEREPGLLATLGQNLRQLRKLDLSYNEMLLDKEFMSMIVSCNCLIELRLRGCKGLTNAAMVSMFKNCRRLESIDIMHCGGIEAEAVEMFVLNSPKLKRIQVEESKISDAARKWVANKFIELVV